MEFVRSRIKFLVLVPFGPASEILPGNSQVEVSCVGFAARRRDRGVDTGDLIDHACDAIGRCELIERMGQSVVTNVPTRGWAPFSAHFDLPAFLRMWMLISTILIG